MQRYASGTTSPTVGGGPVTLATITVQGTFILAIDIANMTGGDTIQIGTNYIMLSGGATHSLLLQSFTGAPTGIGDQVWMSVPFPSDVSIAYTLNQTAGISRAFPWKIFQY
jgi:hypothetical protein